MKKLIVLLSVKPIYANKIFSGEKTIELRRKLPRNMNKGDLVIVYVSSPQKNIFGAFTVKKIIKESPAKLWKTASKKASITKLEFDKYFGSVEIGYGIVIDKCWCFPEPVSFEKIKSQTEKFHIPQSFRYINEKDNILLENMAVYNIA